MRPHASLFILIASIWQNWFQNRRAKVKLEEKRHESSIPSWRDNQSQQSVNRFFSLKPLFSEDSESGHQSDQDPLSGSGAQFLGIESTFEGGNPYTDPLQIAEKNFQLTLSGKAQNSSKTHNFIESKLTKQKMSLNANLNWESKISSLAYSPLLLNSAEQEITPDQIKLKPQQSNLLASSISETLTDPSESACGQENPITFDCILCSRRFVRSCNLYKHLREHRYLLASCGVCGEAFGVRHDCGCDEDLHPKEGKFGCNGPLASGSSWGCGRRYANPEALARHFRSDAGRSCLEPLLEEDSRGSHTAVRGQSDQEIINHQQLSTQQSPQSPP